MSRNSTSAIYIYILFRNSLCKACHHFAKFQHTFLIWKHFVWNVFGTCVRPPWSSAWDRGLWVAINTFLWVLLTHRNFTEDLGTLRKSLQTIQRSCWQLGLHPSPSLLFHKFMYKYEAKPPLNIIIFSSLYCSQTKNKSKHSTFWSSPLKLYID